MARKGAKGASSKKGKGPAASQKRKLQPTRTSPRKKLKLKLRQPEPESSGDESLSDLPSHPPTTAVGSKSATSTRDAQKSPEPAADAGAAADTAAGGQQEPDVQDGDRGDAPTAGGAVEVPANQDAADNVEAGQGDHDDADVHDDEGVAHAEAGDGGAEAADEAAADEGDQDAAQPPPGTVHRPRASYSVDEEDEPALFEYIQAHEVLWNRGSRKYKDTKHKDELWEQLAFQLDNRYSFSHLKGWWRSITTLYGRLHKKKSGQARQKLTDRQQFISDSMTFYDKVVYHRGSSQSLTPLALQPLTSTQPRTGTEQSTSSQPGPSQPSSSSSQPPTLTRESSLTHDPEEEEEPAEEEEGDDMLGQMEERASRNSQTSTSTSRSRPRPHSRVVSQRADDRYFRELKEIMLESNEVLKNMASQRDNTGRDPFLEYVTRTLQGLPEPEYQEAKAIFTETLTRLTAPPAGRPPAPPPPASTAPAQPQPQPPPQPHFPPPAQPPAHLQYRSPGTPLHTSLSYGIPPQLRSMLPSPGPQTLASSPIDQQFLTQMLAQIAASQNSATTTSSSVSRRLLVTPSAAAGSAAQLSTPGTSLGDLSYNNFCPDSYMDMPTVTDIAPLNTPPMPRPGSSSTSAVSRSKAEDLSRVVISEPTTSTSTATTEALVLLRQSSDQLATQISSTDALDTVDTQSTA